MDDGIVALAGVQHGREVGEIPHNGGDPRRPLQVKRGQGIVRVEPSNRMRPMSPAPPVIKTGFFVVAIACSVRLPLAEGALQGSKRWGMLQHDRRGPPVPSCAPLAVLDPGTQRPPTPTDTVSLDRLGARRPAAALGGSHDAPRVVPCPGQPEAPCRDREACDNNTWPPPQSWVWSLSDARREIRQHGRHKTPLKHVKSDR
jgi:hypothetical protein